MQPLRAAAVLPLMPRILPFASVLVRSKNGVVDDRQKHDDGDDDTTTHEKQAFIVRSNNNKQATGCSAKAFVIMGLFIAINYQKLRIERNEGLLLC